MITDKGNHDLWLQNFYKILTIENLLKSLYNMAGLKMIDCISEFETALVINVELGGKNQFLVGKNWSDFLALLVHETECIRCTKFDL